MALLGLTKVFKIPFPNIPIPAWRVVIYLTLPNAEAVSYFSSFLLLFWEYFPVLLYPF